MKNLKKLSLIIIKQYKILIAGLLFMVLFSVFSGLNLAAIKPMLDYIFKPTTESIKYTSYSSFFKACNTQLKIAVKTKNFTIKNNPAINNFTLLLKQTNKMLLLKLIIFIVVITYFLKNLFFVLNKLMFIKLRANTTLIIRKQLFNAYIKQPISWLSHGKTGDALVRISSDTNFVNEQMLLSIFNLLKESSTIIVLIVIAVFINTKLFLFSIFVLPIFAVSVNTIANKVKKYAKRQQKQNAYVLQNIDESLTNMPVIKAFCKEKYEKKKFDKKIDKLMHFWLKSKIYSSFTTPLGEINGSIIAAALLLAGGKMVLNPANNFSFGSFIVFAGAMLSMMKPLKEVSKGVTQIKKSMVSLDRIYEIIDKKNNLTEAKNPVNNIKFTKNIVFKNLNFSYNGKKNVLSNINFEIKKGESIAIVGNSGSGKTTLINLLLRLYNPSSGNIFIDDTNINTLSFKALHTLFGTVTQESLLFSDTIKANISYSGDTILNDAQLKKACDIANATEFIEKLDKKYDYVIDAKGMNFSGGQKQRICIARAVAFNPNILIFDEATSALDTESEQKVKLAIDNATKNRTVITIAHRLSTILNADKILVLDNGEIAGFAPHKQLIKTCKRWQKLYNMQYNNIKENI